MSELATVVLVLPLFYGHARRIREGVAAHVEAHGGWRLVECEPAQAETDPRVFAKADAVIAWTRPGAEWLERLARGGMPVVHCGDWASGDSPVAVVATDWPSLAELAIRHFRELGLGACALAGRSLGPGEPLRERVVRFHRMVRCMGMEPFVHRMDEHAWPGLPAGRPDEGLAAFLAGLPPRSGVLCEDDPAAVRVIETAHAAGLEVPRDLAVIGQGNRLVGRTGRPAVTTIVPPGTEIGLKAAEVLAARLLGAPAGGTWRVECRDLLVRGSTVMETGDLALERAWRLFDRRAELGVTVQELAVKAGLSGKTLVKRFRERFGIDPSVEIRRRRHEEAKRLIRETDLGLAEVGARCGFPSPSNFFNFFRRHSGMGPAEFRRKMREENPPSA